MTEIISTNKNQVDSPYFEKAAEAIRDGGLVIYPTETVYGLAADATSDEAVSKVFKTKNRPYGKPISIAVNSLSMSYQVGKLTKKEEKIIRKLLPNPLTIVVESRPSISSLLTGGTGKIGIRIPDFPLVLKLISEIGNPITSTSANITGNPPPKTVAEALDQLDKEVDLAIDAGETPGGEPSTVIEIKENKVKTIREGPIKISKIKAVLED